MKTVEHIVWENRIHGNVGEKITSLCEIELVWHGGGNDRYISEGTYEFTDHGIFTNYGLGIKIGENTTGLSAVHLIRVGTIVE